MNYDEINRCDMEPSQQELDLDLDAVDQARARLEPNPDYVWDYKLWKWVPKLKFTGEVYDARIDGLN